MCWLCYRLIKQYIMWYSSMTHHSYICPSLMNTYRFIIIILLSYFFFVFIIPNDTIDRFSSLHGDGYRISREVLSHRADHLKSGKDNHLSKDFLIFVSDSVHVLKAKLIFYNLGAARSQTRREYWWRGYGYHYKMSNIIQTRHIYCYTLGHRWHIHHAVDKTSLGYA